MSDMTKAFQSATLNAFFNGGAMPSPDPIYIRLLTMVDPARTTSTEVTVGQWPSYTRQGLTNDTDFSDSSAGSAVTNSALVDFGTADVGANLPLAGFGTADAATAGNFEIEAWMGQTIQSFTATAADDTFTKTSHGYVDGTPIIFDPRGTTLPTGIVGGTIYYVRDAAANTFKVAATSGGSAINITADGSGDMRGCYIVQATFPVTFPIGTLSFQ